MKAIFLLFTFFSLNISFCQTQYEKLPKVELHLHLDCSLSFNVVQKLNPSISFEEYRKDFVAPAKCPSLADYITRAIKGVELMQTRDQLRLVTLDLFEQLKADKVIYAEIRFAPLLHLSKGLSAEEVVAAVNEAVDEGIRNTGVEAGIILCTLRHFSEEQSLATVHLFGKFRNTHVVGFDIAADEAGFPITNHVKAFDYAHANGIHCTAHAGEAKGAESVRETLQFFRPSRIGHGVRSMEDTSLIKYLKDNSIHLEVCPTSNVQTNVFDKIANHNIDRIFNAGVSMSINTDARTISDVTLAMEYATLEKYFNWDKKHFLKCNLEAINHAFTSDEKKASIREKLLNAYKK
jgi:adenosine deaminase